MVLLPVGALLVREVVRFVRDRNRVFGALVQPVIFWALFGAGLRASFHPPAGETVGSYAAYLFPGTVVLILLFTAIFSTISLIEDRREGFLQGVLVAPVARSSIVLGKVLGGTTLALGQGTLVLLCAPIVGVETSPVAMLAAIPVLFVLAFALTSLSFCIAWRMDSTQGFHAIMTVLLMPLWLLSGAFFPAEGTPGWLGFLMRIDPLTYGLAAFRHTLALGGGTPPSGIPGYGLSFTLTVVFTQAAYGTAVALARRPLTTDSGGR